MADVATLFEAGVPVIPSEKYCLAHTILAPAGAEVVRVSVVPATLKSTPATCGTPPTNTSVALVLPDCGKVNDAVPPVYCVTVGSRSDLFTRNPLMLCTPLEDDTVDLNLFEVQSLDAVLH